MPSTESTTDTSPAQSKDVRRFDEAFKCEVAALASQPGANQEPVARGLGVSPCRGRHHVCCHPRGQALRGQRARRIAAASTPAMPAVIDRLRRPGAIPSLSCPANCYGQRRRGELLGHAPERADPGPGLCCPRRGEKRNLLLRPRSAITERGSTARAAPLPPGGLRAQSEPRTPHPRAPTCPHQRGKIKGSRSRVGILTLPRAKTTATPTF